MAHSTQNNLEEALRDLNKAVALAPRTLDAYYNRAMVFTKMGRLLKAVEDYTTAIRLNEHTRNFMSPAVTFGKVSKS